MITDELYHRLRRFARGNIDFIEDFSLGHAENLPPKWQSREGLSEARPGITWGCDIGCPFNGKGSCPSRSWGIPSVPGAFYFDSVFHAKRVPTTCRVEITRLGMGDYTCPPRGVLLSYYNLKCPAKANLVQGSTHGYVPPSPNQTFTISK